MQTSRTVLIGAMAVGTAVAPVGPIAASAQAPPPTTTIASLSDKSATAARQGGYEPSLSGDGRWVSFESQSLLAHIPTGGSSQVYVRDRKTGRTDLVSRASGAAGKIGNRGSDAGSISADGRFVAFESSARNLVSGFQSQNRGACDISDGEHLGDVYLRDRKAHTTILVSHVPGSTTKPGDYYSEDPHISRNGNVIVFASAASNIADDGGSAAVGGCPDPHNPDQQLYAYHRLTGKVSMVRADDGSVPNGPVDAYAVSGNGGTVAFSTDATNMLASGAMPSANAYVQTLSNGTNELVSRTSGASGDVADGGAGSVSIDGRGNRVTFTSESSNLGGGSGSAQQVYLRDRTAQTTTDVSVTSSGQPGNGDSGPAAISDDGRYIAIETAADNLGGHTAGNGDEFTQIVVRDVTAGTTTLVSRASGIATPRANKTGAEDLAISGDGHTVAFESKATNLDRRTTFAAVQVFVRGKLYLPAVLDKAAVSGNVRVGSTVHCAVRFTKGAQVSYQWLDNGKPIAKETKQRFTIARSRVGHKLACRATGTLGDGPATSTSPAKKVAP